MCAGMAAGKSITSLDTRYLLFLIQFLEKYENRNRGFLLVLFTPQVLPLLPQNFFL